VRLQSPLETPQPESLNPEGEQIRPEGLRSLTMLAVLFYASGTFSIQIGCRFAI
jgi:hypothetical protein